MKKIAIIDNIVKFIQNAYNRIPWVARRLAIKAENERIAKPKAEKDKIRRKKFSAKFNSEMEEVYRRVEESNKTRAAESKLKNDEINGMCPKCQSKSVVDKFRKMEGSAKASSRSYGAWYGSSSDSRVDVTTVKVNVCRDCGNEWEKGNWDEHPDNSMLMETAALQLSHEIHIPDRASDRSPFWLELFILYWGGLSVSTVCEYIKLNRSSFRHIEPQQISQELRDIYHLKPEYEIEED